MPDESTTTLGGVLDRAIEDARRRWAKKYAGVRVREEFLASELTTLEVHAALTRGRGQYIYITVMSRNYWQAETYGYRILGHRFSEYSTEIQNVI